MAAPDITGQLAQYMVNSRQQDLPPEVAEAGKHRILDSIGAIVPVPASGRARWLSDTCGPRGACRRLLS